MVVGGGKRQGPIKLGTIFGLGGVATYFREKQLQFINSSQARLRDLNPKFPPLDLLAHHRDMA